ACSRVLARARARTRGGRREGGGSCRRLPFDDVAAVGGLDHREPESERAETFVPVDEGTLATPNPREKIAQLPPVRRFGEGRRGHHRGSSGSGGRLHRQWRRRAAVVNEHAAVAAQLEACAEAS